MHTNSPPIWKLHEERHICILLGINQWGKRRKAHLGQWLPNGAAGLTQEDCIRSVWFRVRPLTACTQCTRLDTNTGTPVSYWSIGTHSPATLHHSPGWEFTFRYTVQHWHCGHILDTSNHRSGVRCHKWRPFYETWLLGRQTNYKAPVT